MTAQHPTFISLFSGCGGFDIGFKEAGYKCLGAFDTDALVLTNLKKNTGSAVFQTDLSSATLSSSDYCAGIPDVIISGSPCQGFSVIGKRKYEDPRNDLLVSAAKIGTEINPKVFIAENVLGVTSGKHREYWKLAHNILAKGGYHTTDIILDANNYGVPQHRKRIFLVANRGNRHNFNISTEYGGTLKDALKDISGAKNHLEEFPNCQTKDYLIAKRIQQGQKLSNVRGGNRSIHTWDIPEVFGKVTEAERALLEELIYLRRRMRIRDFGDADPIPRKILIEKYSKKIIASLLRKNYLRQLGDSLDLVGAFNGKYRRLRLDKPSCTVDTRFGIPKNFLHPFLHRGFTVREAARIQGFPDAYQFSGSISEQFRMIGNAVPPPLARILGHYIRKNIIGV